MPERQSPRRAAAAPRRWSAAGSSCRRRWVRRCRSGRRAARRGRGPSRRAARSSPPCRRRAALHGRAGSRPQVLDPDDDLARARRAAAGEGALRQGQLADLLRRLRAFREQPLQAGLVLVHLRELALAPIALDELALALDLLVPGVRRPSPPGRRARRAGGGTRRSRPGTRSAAGRAAPRRGSPWHRGRPGRGTPPGARRNAVGGGPRATRARRGRGGWSARRAAAGPDRR